MKTSIIKYDKIRKEIENQEIELIMNYKENYEQKKNSIYEMYQNYITERENRFELRNIYWINIWSKITNYFLKTIFMLNM